MESSIPAFNAANLSRKRSGVWELNLDGSYDDGNFIVVSEFGRKDPMFGVAGYGGFAPVVSISDAEQISTKGWYGRSCRVQITVANKSFTYGCDDYLSRKALGKVLKDMRGALEDAIVKKASDRNA